MRKRQGSIEASIYGVEFQATQIAVDEVQLVRYMFRFLGVKVNSASLIFGNNK